jgi:hypothetical protein
MNIQGPKRNNNSVRERQMARKRRHEERVQQRKATTKPKRSNGSNNPRWQLMLQDAQFYLRQSRWLVRGGLTVGAVILVLFFLTTVFSGNIYRNVTVMDVNIGGMSTPEATARLRDAWNNEIQIDVVAEGEVVDQLAPSALGLQLDAAATVALAKDLSFRFGLVQTPVQPVITLTDSGYLTTQDYLLNMSETVNEAPFNPGFAWQGDTLVTVPARPGRLLDIAPTLASLVETPEVIVELRQFIVFTVPVQPDAQDAAPYLDAVREYASQPFTLAGYDPFRDELIRWSTDRDTLTSWIAVTSSGLSLRETVFAPFIQAQTRSLNEQDGNDNRFLNTEETINRVRNAIATRQSTVDLRIRYRPHQYVIEPGDTASKIARKTGIPLYLVQQHNAGRDLDFLSIGDTLNMPTRDVTMPNEPIPGKRIVVNLETQELWAFENEQVVFNWDISSGRSNAPTSPGIYQILNHDETASGSSFTLCDDIGCGQWEMYWFMGIYEVVPGLVNGFHGAVLLPNGAFLNGGAVGFPSTFGCVMSPNDLAKALYEWAEVGTVVEIVSSEFEPVSALAQQTQNL